MNPQNHLPTWIVEANRHTLAFAQVREDPLLDLAVLEHLDRPARILMVASGGCTAAALVASGRAAEVHLVDVNPAQIALTRLKLYLLQHATHETRLKLLGHRAMRADDRLYSVRAILDELEIPSDIFGPTELWADIGLDFAGRYERLFAELHQWLDPVKSDVAVVLRLEDPRKQSEIANPKTSLGQAIGAALQEVMAQENLVALFGERATRNRVESFADHFERRVLTALSTLPAATNPFLWQMLCGRFPVDFHYPWLTASAPEKRPEVRWGCADMLSVLKSRPGIYDYVHLSNILDWLSVEEARDTLQQAAAVLGPGGQVLIRQLNSSLDVQALGPMFDWQTSRAGDLHRRDRSFFYRALHWGRRR
jgi:S-adenosylmethionine-diacylglycerol 3-amino-3-carboxypropyl transferase